jgi:hypothetical protein
MKRKTYQIKLVGLTTPKGTISFEALSELTSLFNDVSAKSLRLSIDGSSTLQGKKPKWLKNSTDFLITALKKGSTIVEISAPLLGETAKDAIKQQNIWNSAPEESDTAFSILMKSVQDILDENLESAFIDSGVLDSVNRFKEFSHKQKATVTFGEAGSKNAKVVFDNHVFDKVTQVKSKTPVPRALILSGILDLISYRKSRFELHLEDGGKVIGIFKKDHIDHETIRAYWGNRITVKGMGSFRPSGKLATIEVDVLKVFEEGEEMFLIPQTTIFSDSSKLQPSANDALSQLWGKWMGDESITELLEALKN